MPIKVKVVDSGREDTSIAKSEIRYKKSLDRKNSKLAALVNNHRSFMLEEL